MVSMFFLRIQMLYPFSVVHRPFLVLTAKQSHAADRVLCKVRGNLGTNFMKLGRGFLA